jgi:hypothetical protein
MKTIFAMGVAASLILPAVFAQAGALPLTPQVGDTYEITRTQTSVQQGSNGSSGNSNDKDTIIERVIGLRADGIELEYDLPKEAQAEENWQFPVRVFKPDHGAAQLLNQPELEARVDSWLKDAKLTRASCGHWYFTWNAFQVECDPQSAIKAIDSFDMKISDLRDGASYEDAEALTAGVLEQKKGPTGATFATEMPIDPDAVRHARAESDVVVGEIMRKPVTLDDALRVRAKEAISGTISVVFEADSSGNPFRRTKVTKVNITGSDGRTENDVITQTLDRKLISSKN